MAEQVQINQIIDHFFRHESGKIVSILTRIFGTEHLNLAEDVLEDSLVEAMNQWQYSGVPDNPSGWLFRVAKNKALNVLKREKYKQEYASEVNHLLEIEQTHDGDFTDFVTEEEIQDDQLRMMFTCCHPDIPPDSQIALALKTLCGFSIPEIAKAFLTSEENVNKRLVRARQKLRDHKIPFEVPDRDALEKRLTAVIEIIYLLFNEGYSASKGNDIIRYELCEEAIRLGQIIAAHKAIPRKGNVFALLSLMFLNASRFKARQNIEGELLTMAEQDRTLWDENMKGIGLRYLNDSTKDESISIYHILAAISAQYCIAPDYESTNWKGILSLYESLVRLDNSPVVLLNRAIVISKVYGPEKALEALKEIEDNPTLKNYHLFYSTEAEFFTQLGQFANAKNSLQKAIQFASLQAEKNLLQKKMNSMTIRDANHASNHESTSSIDMKEYQ